MHAATKICYELHVTSTREVLYYAWKETELNL